MQPTDVAFMEQVSTYYDRVALSWLRLHPGRVVSEIFGNAFVQAATMSTAIHAFKKCGIRPCNRNNFKENDFISAETTDMKNIVNSSNMEQQRDTEAERVFNRGKFHLFVQSQ